MPLRLKSLFKPNNWETLYDEVNKMYFYRHKRTGEFSRNDPNFPGEEDVLTKDIPMYETKIDMSSKEMYWEDIETGKVFFSQPESGLFLAETDLEVFRRGALRHPKAPPAPVVNKRAVSQPPPRKKMSSVSTKKSISSNMPIESETKQKKKKSAAAEKKEKRKSQSSGRRVKSANPKGNNIAKDAEYTSLFGNANPAAFDAGALFAMAPVAAPPSDSSSGGMTDNPMFQSSNDEILDEEEDQFEVEEEQQEEEVSPQEEAEEVSMFSSDNPMFQRSW